MNALPPQPPIALDDQNLRRLLPARRRMAGIAVTVSWLMAAVFLMLGMEARSHELRATRAATHVTSAVH